MYDKWVPSSGQQMEGDDMYTIYQFGSLHETHVFYMKLPLVKIQK